MNKLRILFVSVLCAVAALSAAQGVVGKWQGQIISDKVDLPADLTAEQRHTIESALAMLKKIRVNMDVRPNKTYTATFTGLPKGQKQVNEGTWELKGDKLWIKSVKQNGKKSQVKEPQAITVAKNRKTMTLVLPNKGAGGGKILFKRA